MNNAVMPPPRTRTGNVEGGYDSLADKVTAALFILAYAALFVFIAVLCVADLT